MLNGYLHWKCRVLLITLHNSSHGQTVCYCCVASVSTQRSQVLTCMFSIEHARCSLSKFTYCLKRIFSIALYWCVDNPKPISYLSTSNWSAGGQHGDVLHKKGFSKTVTQNILNHQTRHFSQTDHSSRLNLPTLCSAVDTLDCALLLKVDVEFHCSVAWNDLTGLYFIV